MNEKTNDKCIWLYTNYDTIIAFAKQEDATKHLNKHHGRVRKIMLFDSEEI